MIELLKSKALADDILNVPHHAKRELLDKIIKVRTKKAQANTVR